MQSAGMEVGVQHHCSVSAFQVAALSIHASDYLPWHDARASTALSTLGSTLLVRPQSAISEGYSTSALVFVCVLWACSFVVLCFLGHSITKPRRPRERVFKPKLLVSFIHHAVVTSTTFGFLPTCSVLTSPLVCVGQDADATWLDGVQCWSPAHLAGVTACTFALAGFLALTVYVSLLHVQTDVTCAEAAAHGRVHAAALVIQACITALQAMHHGLAPWFIISATLVSTGLEGYLWARYMPNINMALNCTRAAAGAAGVWACLCALVAIAEGGLTANSSHLLVFVTPLVVLVVFIGVQERFQHLHTSLSEPGSAYLLELKVRSLVQRSKRFAERCMDEAMRATVRGMEDSSQEIPMGFHGLGVRGPLTATLAQAEAILAMGLTQFPSSSFMHVAAATFVRMWRGNTHVETSHLEALSAKHPASDEAYRARVRSHQLEALAKKHDEEHLRIQERVQFEEFRAEARMHETTARGLIAAFWSALASRSATVVKLVDLAERIEKSSESAEEAYLGVLSINKRSVTVMRGYAAFLDAVMNDPRQATGMLQEADALEEELSQEHQSKRATFQFLGCVNTLDSSAENMAVLSCSDQERSLGMITEVNAAALGTFGYSKREMLNKSINSLMPEPIASLHNKFMRAYLSTGRGSMMNTVRMVLGVHSAGHIFPMLLSARSLKHGFGALMQPMATQHNFILFLSNSGTISSACKTSLSMLGHSAEDVNACNLNLSAFLPHFNSARALCEQLGDVKQFDDQDTSLVEVEMAARELGLAVDRLRGGLIATLQKVSRHFPAAVSQASTLATRRGGGGKGRTRKPKHLALRVWLRMQTTSIGAGDLPNALPGDRLSVLMWEVAELPKTSSVVSPTGSGVGMGVNMLPSIPSVSPMKAPGVATAPARLADVDHGAASDHSDDLSSLLDSSSEGESVRPYVEESARSQAGPVADQGLPGILKRAPDVGQPKDAKAGPRAAGSAQSVATAVQSAGTLDPPSAQVVKTVSMDVHGQVSRPGSLVGEQSSALQVDASDGPHQDAALEGSVARSGSLNSAESRSTLGSTVRGIVTARNRKPEQAVVALRSSVLGTLLLTLVLMTTTTVLINVLFHEYALTLNLLEETAERQLRAQTLQLAAEDQVLLANVLDITVPGTPEFEVAEEEYDINQRLIQRSLADFERRNRQVFAAIDTLQGDGQRELHIETELTLQADQHDDSFSYKVNLLDATLEFMAHMRVLGQQDYTQVLAAEGGHLRWLEANMRDVLIPQLNATTVQADVTFVKQGTEAEVSRTILFWCSMGVLAVVAAFILLPMTFIALNTRNRMWQLLFNLPRRLVQAFQANSQAKAATFTAEAAGIEEPEREEELEGELENWGRLSNVRFKVDSKRRLRMQVGELVWTLIVFSSPLLLASAYYIATLLWSNATSADIQGTGHTSMWGYQREVVSMQLLAATQRAMQTDDVQEASILAEQGLALSRELLWIQEALLYGDEQAGILPARSSENRLNLQLRNGCVDGENAGLCSSLYAGVLRNGIQAGVEKYVTEARLLLVERLSSIQAGRPAPREERLRNQGLLDIRAFAQKPLQDAFYASSQAGSQKTAATMDKFLREQLLATLGVAGALLLGYFVVQMPRIKRLDEEVKLSRGTLLYIPAASLEAIPAVRTLLIRAGVLNKSYALVQS